MFWGKEKKSFTFFIHEIKHLIDHHKEREKERERERERERKKERERPIMCFLFTSESSSALYLFFSPLTGEWHCGRALDDVEVHNRAVRAGFIATRGGGAKKNC